MTLPVFFWWGGGGGGKSHYIAYSSRIGGHYAIYVMIHASWNRLLMANTYLYDVTNNAESVWIFKQRVSRKRIV